MKKSIIVGILLIGFVFIYLVVKQSLFGQVTVDEAKKIPIDEYQILSFELNADNIEILPNSRNDLVIKLDGKISKGLEDDYTLKVEGKGERLKVSYLLDNKGIQFGNEINVAAQVLIPEKVYSELEIQTSSGDIDAQGITAKNLAIQSSSGNVMIKDSQSDNSVLIQSSSGNVNLEHNSFKKFSIKTSSGLIKANGLSAQSGQIHSKSGKVAMDLAEIMSNLDIVTSSGDVEILLEKEPESLQFDFETSSGEQKIGLPKLLYKDKGKHRAIGIIGTGENIINIKTSSGDLKVD